MGLVKIGLDLKIRVLHHKEQLLRPEITNYDTLRFERDSSVFAQIAETDGTSAVPDQLEPEHEDSLVPTYALPQGTAVVKTNENNRLEATRKNSYGYEMAYTTAGALSKLDLPEDLHPRNRAILAYLKKLEQDTPVIIDWC